MLALLLVAGLGLEAEVEKLAHEDHEVRARARRVLLEAGDRAVPVLRDGLHADDVEARRGAAHLLDTLVRRSLREPRNNAAYKIPDNKQVQQLRSLKRHAGFQNVVLQKRNVMRHFAAAYRGGLYHWSEPTRNDFNGLFVSFTGYVTKTAAKAHGIDVLENLLAADAILWKLEDLGADFTKSHWTTRWLVRRDVLPELTATIARRGKDLTTAEANLYRRALRFMKPLCDETAERAHAKLVTRLSKIRKQ